MEVKKVGVLGAGAMGAGIAQICAEASLQVVLVDLEQSFVDRGINSMVKNWDRNITKGRMAQDDKNNYLKNIKTSTDNNDFKDCDLVVEVIVENIEVKRKVFQELNKICPPDTILASNTSGLSITEIAAASGRADKVVGMHFFNPVPVMKLVEIVAGPETTQEVVETAMEVCKIIGKTPIPAKDAPGFIVNRILVPYLNDAAMAYQEGIASPAEIDEAMKLGANMPIGPLALCDLIGIDVLLMVIENFYKEFGDPKFRPALVFKQKVRAGHFGVKTGKGFYDYN